MEFREVRNSKKCVKSGLFFWEKNTRKKKKKKGKKEKGNKSGGKKDWEKRFLFVVFTF